MAATTCRLLHLPLSPLSQTSRAKRCLQSTLAVCILKAKETFKKINVMFVSFFFRSVKFNCWVSPHILIRDGMCLTANKLSLSDLWQTSLSLQSISGSPAGPSKQRCSAGEGEAEENYRLPVLFFVALALHSTPLHHPWRWIACGHLTPTLGNLFFFLA